MVDPEFAKPIEFSYIFKIFWPNHGRILPALTYNGPQPLNVNAGRILPGFGRKLGNIGKLECGSAKLIFWLIFLENCMRMKKIGPLWALSLGAATARTDLKWQKVHERAIS